MVTWHFVWLLVAGCLLLVACCRLLDAGCWLLVACCWLLDAGWLVRLAPLLVLQELVNSSIGKLVN
jgi:hypothetical protein